MNAYFLMSVLTVIVFCTALLLCKRSEFTAKIGFISWISLSVYFVIEYIVMRATTMPYHILKQPMSDLGVTSCGPNTYELALFEICSPYHLLMNWTFALTGMVIFVGTLFLHPFWPHHRNTKAATVLFVVFGLSYTIAGIVPADVDFMWHTLGSLPGMVVQIPALILIGWSIRKKMPRLSIWTFICACVTTSSLILLFFQPIFNALPGGLLQRILYGSVYLWMTTTAIVLWKRRRVNAKK